MNDMRKIFLQLSKGCTKVQKPKNKEEAVKELTRKGDQKEKQVTKKWNQNDKRPELVDKIEPLKMTRVARKRWKLAKNMFIALRRNKEEVGAI